jgi:maltooligosyltrehalose trehalohydrolase
MTRTQSRTPSRRRFTAGAEYVAPDTVHFRVWAPAASRVDVVFDNDKRREPLDREDGGFFSGVINARPGDDYGFALNGADRVLADPASRYQPHGPHGSSRIVDPRAFRWTDNDWRGVRLEGQVIYEMHVGTFTPEGTWASAADQIGALADLGVTVIEMMPIAEFEGRFGWGYDGVDLYAPYHEYGSPDDLRAFVDRAHAANVAVILDVVYNHLGPVGNYLREFSPAYFSDRYENEWGDAINFDGADSGPVRDYFADNAAYWIDEFHFDGLRLDATQQIFDASPEHIVKVIGQRVRAAAGTRSTIVVAENEPQDTRLVRALEANGYGLDALWNDDFHHSALVALTGHAEAYYSDTTGSAQEFISAAKYGYLFQGQHYAWQRGSRGTPDLDVAPAHFVTYLQNHDQIANSALGLRGHELTSPGKWRAMTALFLLMPGTPMLFQGQEFASSTRFLYFADFDKDLAEAVRNGRAEFLTQFPSIADPEMQAHLDDPGAIQTFAQCRLDFAERERHAEAYALHRDLLRLRRETPAFQRQAVHGVDGSVINEHTFMLRFFGETPYDDRLVVVNLGAVVRRPSIADPLIAPPADRTWETAWSSERPVYGASGTAPLYCEGQLCIPGESTYVLAPVVDHKPKKRTIRRRTA